MEKLNAILENSKILHEEQGAFGMDYIAEISSELSHLFEVESGEDVDDEDYEPVFFERLASQNAIVGYFNIHPHFDGVGSAIECYFIQNETSYAIMLCPKFYVLPATI